MAYSDAMLRDLEALLDKHKPTAAEFGAAVADLIYNAEALGRLDKAAPARAAKAGR
jgi:hypothetical protein